MEGIKLKESSFISWSYRWISGGPKLSDSVCKTWWAVLGGWAVMLFTLPAFLLVLLISGKEGRKHPEDYHFGISLVLMLIGTVIGLITHSLWINSWQEILVGLGSMLVLIVFSGIIGLIVTGIGRSFVWLKDKRFDWKMDRMTQEQRIAYWKNEAAQRQAIRDKQAKKSFIRIGFESFIGKYCPKITWAK